MSNPLKKTMVFLGLAEEELEDARTEHTPETRSVPERQPESEQKAPVTPLRKVSPVRGTPVREPQAPTMNEILTVHPTEYREAQLVAENFRGNIPVILNLSRMNDAEAQRMIDFCSGLSLGLRGKFERVTSKVFLLTPEHIAVSGESQQEDAAATGSIFARSRS